MRSKLPSSMRGIEIPARAETCARVCDRDSRSAVLRLKTFGIHVAHLILVQKCTELAQFSDEDTYLRPLWTKVVIIMF